MSEVQVQQWEIKNMPGPLAMPVPSGGIEAGEKFEIHLSRATERAVVELVVHYAARIVLESELEKLQENLRRVAKLNVYPRVLRAFVNYKLIGGWNPVSDPKLTLDDKSMQALLDQFKRDGVF